MGGKFKDFGEVEATLDRKEGKNVTAGHSSAAIVGRSAKRSDARVLNLEPNISWQGFLLHFPLTLLLC